MSSVNVNRMMEAGLYQYMPPSIEPVSADEQILAASRYLRERYGDPPVRRYGEPGGEETSGVGWYRVVDGECVQIPPPGEEPGPSLTVGKYGSTFVAEMVDGELVWSRTPPPNAAEQAARIAGWYSEPAIFDEYAAWQSPWWARVLAWVILLRVLLERVRG